MAMMNREKQTMSDETKALLLTVLDCFLDKELFEAGEITASDYICGLWEKRGLVDCLNLKMKGIDNE